MHKRGSIDKRKAAKVFSCSLCFFTFVVMGDGVVG